jgi:RNA 2',3'-cyclic 3'-phosphodiesterase
MQNAETWRLFVAIRLPDPVQAAIENAQAELRRTLPEPGVRWTRREQLHLTLSFLGDVEAQRADALIESLRRGCRNAPSLRLRAAGIGAFPNLKSPRVFWVGVHEARDQLASLQGAVAAAVRDFTVEKPPGRFTGHITLGRAKDLKPSSAQPLAKLAAAMADRVFGEWTADQVELIRSELRPAGARHTTLDAIALAGAPAADLKTL